MPRIRSVHPGTGKSTLAQNIVEQVTLRGKTAVFFSLAMQATLPGKQRYLLAYCVLTAERRRHLNLRRIPVRETVQVLRVSPRTFFRAFVQTGRWAEISRQVREGTESARGKAVEALA